MRPPAGRSRPVWPSQTGWALLIAFLLAGAPADMSPHAAWVPSPPCRLRPHLRRGGPLPGHPGPDCGRELAEWPVGGEGYGTSWQGVLEAYHRPPAARRAPLCTPGGHWGRGPARRPVWRRAMPAGPPAVSTTCVCRGRAGKRGAFLPPPSLQRFDFDLIGTGVGCGHGRPGAQGSTRWGRMRSPPPNCLPPPNPLTHSPAPPTHCPPACSWPASPTSLPCWPTSPCWPPTTLPSKLCWPTLPPR